MPDLNSWCSHLYLACVIAPVESAPAGGFIAHRDAADDNLQKQASFEIISDSHRYLFSTLVTSCCQAMLSVCF